MTLLHHAPRVVCLTAFLMMTGCQDEPTAMAAEPAKVYQQLVAMPPAASVRELQASVESRQPGYSNYLRFRLDPAGVRDLLHGQWRTVACTEVEQRLVITSSSEGAFKPPWNPLVELNCRCFEGEFDTALGPGHQVLLLDDHGLAHIHAASR